MEARYRVSPANDTQKKQLYAADFMGGVSFTEYSPKMAESQRRDSAIFLTPIKLNIELRDKHRIIFGIHAGKRNGHSIYLGAENTTFNDKFL